FFPFHLVRGQFRDNGDSNAPPDRELPATRPRGVLKERLRSSTHVEPNSYSPSGSAVFRRAAISWARSRELTPQKVWPLLRSLGGIEQTLSASEGDLAHGLGSSERARALLRSASDREADRYAEDLRRSGIEILTAFDERYPRPLFEIADPPFV